MELRLKNITSYSKEQTTKIDLRKKINKHYLWTKWRWEVNNIQFFL